MKKIAMNLNLFAIKLANMYTKYSITLTVLITKNPTEARNGPIIWPGSILSI
jgi:hypothetical protein